MRYMGSKARIAENITRYINDIISLEHITDYYEPFMGGCSVGELVKAENRHLSDINKHIVALFKKLQEPFMGGCSVGELVKAENRHLSDINKHIVALFKKLQEPFMGGCSVGELVKAENRHLSDINKHIVALFKKLQEPFMFNYEYITREEWYKIKDDRHENKLYPEWLTGYCSVAASYRGRAFEGYAGTYIDKTYGREVCQQEQVYRQLVRERELVKDIDFQCRKYNEIEKPYHSVIYCDAPYRGTKQYTMVEQFDFDAYDEWLIKMSKDNLVLISEYLMSGKHADKFIRLDSWTLKSGIGVGNTDVKTETIENLYYVDGGWLTDKYFKETFEEDDDF